MININNINSFPALFSQSSAAFPTKSRQDGVSKAHMVARVSFDTTNKWVDSVDVFIGL